MTAIAPDLASPAFVADPYPTYARLREHAPIQRVRLPDGFAVWLVTRYDDVVAIFKDERFVKDYRNTLPPDQRAQFHSGPGVFAILNRHMLDRDPPDHTRLRALVSKAFTPRMIEQLRPRIQTIADDLLQAVQDQGQMDLIDAYAFPLPITVISEMLGVPLADRDTFRRWSNVLVGDSPDPAGQYEAAVGFTTYLRDLVNQRRRTPASDLISGLVQAEEQGDKLSEDELLAMLFLLLVAGHETTVNLIGNGTLALLQHPDQMQKLRDDPTLLKPAIEELLRYDGPVETSTFRFAREDVEIGGQTIRRGEPVLVVIAAANHDPAHFAAPDQLDVTRTDNRHVAFGHGIHFCLGAPLARMEGQIAIGTLLRRMPDLRLAVPADQLQWRPGLLIRGLQRLPVEF